MVQRLEVWRACEGPNLKLAMAMARARALNVEIDGTDGPSVDGRPSVDDGNESATASGPEPDCVVTHSASHAYNRLFRDDDRALSGEVGQTTQTIWDTYDDATYDDATKQLIEAAKDIWSWQEFFKNSKEITEKHTSLVSGMSDWAAEVRVSVRLSIVGYLEHGSIVSVRPEYASLMSRYQELLDQCCAVNEELLQKCRAADRMATIEE